MEHFEICSVWFCKQQLNNYLLYHLLIWKIQNYRVKFPLDLDVTTSGSYSFFLIIFSEEIVF